MPVRKVADILDGPACGKEGTTFILRALYDLFDAIEPDKQAHVMSRLEEGAA